MNKEFEEIITTVMDENTKKNNKKNVANYIYIPKLQIDIINLGKLSD